LAADNPVDLKSLPALKRTIVPQLHEAIKVDGELEDAGWKKAAVLEPFLRNDGSGPEREHTQVRLGYDDKALFLAWICRDKDIQATFTNRDSMFWEEEVVEFFVTAKDLNHYFELQWNPLGGVFDATIANDLDTNGVSKSFKGEWSFTATTMTSSVKVKGTVASISPAGLVTWSSEIEAWLFTSG
jgi:hypothetical protein